MPESKVRKDAADKRKQTDKAELRAQKAERQRLAGGPDRSWVPWVFVPLGLLGVAWLVIYYIAGDFMPGIAGGWNVLVGMGLMAAAFAVATLWK